MEDVSYRKTTKKNRGGRNLTRRHKPFSLSQFDKFGKELQTARAIFTFPPDVATPRIFTTFAPVYQGETPLKKAVVLTLYPYNFPVATFEW